MKIASEGRAGKWIKSAIIVAINILLWAIPSNVSYLIAQNRDVLLGRYSVARLTWVFLLIPISIMALYLTWSNEENKKRRQFQITALTLSIVITIILADLFMRPAQNKQYVLHKSYYHRTPNTVFSGTFYDVPENAFSYPTMRPGYSDIEYTLTTDKRGFRNKTDLEKYDVITLGDSFTEGSNVTDNEIWAALLAQKSKITVYNLGMAGGHPGTYLETFKRFGLNLSPKIVICMICEGNDFRDSNFKRKDTFGYKLNNYFKSSPVRRALEELMVRHLGSTAGNTSEDLLGSRDNPVGSNKTDVDTNSLKALSWLPVAIPDELDAKYYTFTVKNLLAHFDDKETFLRSKSCQKTFANLRQINEICKSNDIRFIMIYAPDKSHVLLPIIQHKVSPESLRAFMLLKASNLPPTDKLIDTVLTRLDIKESEVKKFCREESIEFVSLTEPLREGINLGRQLYFTYDDHWTPIGHEVVANTISRYVEEHPFEKQIID
jgi:hypothetical protein